MARRSRISLDDEQPITGGAPSEAGGGDSDNVDTSGSGDGYSGGDSGDAGRVDPAAILGTGSNGGDDGYIRDDGGNILYDVRGRPRKRRAKRGSRAAKAAGKKVPVDALAQLLMLAHGTIASLTKTPEMEINQNEARMLANPLSELMVLYDITPPPQMLLAMQMIHGCSYVYGPRILMIRSRLKVEAEERRAHAARNVGPVDMGSHDKPTQGPEAQVLDFTGFGDINTNYGGLKN